MWKCKTRKSNAQVRSEGVQLFAQIWMPCQNVLDACLDHVIHGYGSHFLLSCHTFTHSVVHDFLSMVLLISLYLLLLTKTKFQYYILYILFSKLLHILSFSLIKIAVIFEGP